MIAHDVVILSTKISPDALPADTSISISICSRIGHFPKMCFFKDKKQQRIQLVQAHDDQTVPQMSNHSFHDAHEEYMPSDDDFVHNYMIHMYKTSLQSKKCKNSQFQ